MTEERTDNLDDLPLDALKKEIKNFGKEEVVVEEPQGQEEVQAETPQEEQAELPLTRQDK